MVRSTVIYDMRADFTPINDAMIELLMKQAAGTVLNAGDMARLNAWRAEHPGNERVYTEAASPQHVARTLGQMHNFADSKARLRQQLIRTMQVRRIPFVQRSWVRVAAVLLLIAGTAGLLYLNNRPSQEIVTSSIEKPADILPGGNKATLTLADGRTIPLDGTLDGAVARQGNVEVVKLNNGGVIYRSNQTASQEVLMNLLTTPRGGQYQLTLSDGTRVWLNAASSIRYPAAFAKDRTVEITGESYLEVAPDKDKPFYVKINGTTVHVLGTRFNINAYQNEPSYKVSLFEGSVHIGSAILKPGQAWQAGRVTGTDLTQDLAWKNGLFSFNNADLPSVMRQIARWYNVDIVYAPNAKSNEVIIGKIQRTLTLSQMIKVLADLGVYCRIEGEILTVL